MRVPLLASAAILATTICFPPGAFADNPERDRAPLLVVVQLDRTANLSHLKLGERVQGRVKRDVYSGERKIISSGSPIGLTISKPERRRREPSGRWPWVVQLFAPPHIRYPSTFAAMVSLPD